MPSKKTSSASQVMFNRFYRGRPNRIADLKQTIQEMSLGEKIRDLREQAGLTQEQLAAKIGSSKSAVSRIEDANYDSHSLTTLRRIAEALDQRLRVDFEPRRVTSRQERAVERQYARASRIQPAAPGR